MREEAKGTGAALAAAEAVVARAEAAGARDAALQVVAEGAAALAALDLAPDPKASPPLVLSGHAASFTPY